MGILQLPNSLVLAILVSGYLGSICSASPAINVGLKASFSQAPYLLELLETAADENSTSYFPLLDKIADNAFAGAITDEELYTRFIQILQDDGHMRDSESLASYKFALSMRSAAPRIEAHFQYYHTAVEPSLKDGSATICPTWALINGQQYCTIDFEAPHSSVEGNEQTQDLQFDRILGNSAHGPVVLYADITSTSFGSFHKSLVKLAREGRASYRLRHRKAEIFDSTPLIIPGYGVQLALKRTDYIVIDDREDSGDKNMEPVTTSDIKLEDEEIADLKPLSTSELASLSVKASSFIMQSESQFETLVKLSQDFPKYSSAIAAHNISESFLKEHQYNRELLIPAGYNAWFINGVQVIERQIDALSLLDHMRKERKLINGVRNLGFTGFEAIQLLAHPEIASAKSSDEPQRFDWRDDTEGGGVIMWLNDIEKDKRYEEWPSSLRTFLQRTYPGQLPQVRRDCFQLVLPVDFTNEEDMQLVLETLTNFVKRKATIRMGLVPLTGKEDSTGQARLVYYLLETYGLTAALGYLENAYKSKELAKPYKSGFQKAIEGRDPRQDREELSFESIQESEYFGQKILGSRAWVSRLAADSEVPPIFVDGVALPRDEAWLQTMSQRVNTDLQAIQQSIFTGTIDPDAWLPEGFLQKAVLQRNPLIIPEDEKSLRLFDFNALYTENEEIFATSPQFTADLSTPKADWAHVILIADVSTQAGFELLKNAIDFKNENPSVELVIVPNPTTNENGVGLNEKLHSYVSKRLNSELKDIKDLESLPLPGNSEEIENLHSKASTNLHSATPLMNSLSLTPGQSGILINGRLVGPIPEKVGFKTKDFEQLLSYERVNRISPAFLAVEMLELSDKLKDPLTGAKISSIIAVSSVSDAPAGMFEQGTMLRMAEFEQWNDTYTMLEVGNKVTATIQMTIVIDPASEQGQRWIPIVKVLSELDGLYVKIFLNPKEMLQELPVKRFYRYVLDSKPSFDDQGSLKPLGASFKAVPQEALLTVGLDVPPAWLVAPKVSIHDLDNIKLSSTKTDVDALYELEYILIQGHSRETSGGSPPRGAQLVLGTERDPHTADTIIMSNLGFFQFKANPGYYKINLENGRSSDIFKIESVGSHGYKPILGDNNTDVVLLSFQGATLYPRLSRNPGMELEDVLEAKSESAVADLVSRGLNFAQGILSGKGKEAQPEVHADINIFSVASGHLYERMLNIMMVSVMKHTKHTVKFWFIEQFLSPSFKDFIPYLAAEYGFKYEMVTYKWPHWLRQQTEKQREIWGYKILFLDVLFPLSLDKVIFVDADQIVRTDMIELVNHDLQGAPYGFTPMCDSRTEMEGFRFWKQGYWEKFLRGLPYHISALYVVDLHRFRQIAAGDRLRQQYHQLSADPGSLSNLDQDLPNHMQAMLPIHSLPQEWLWCETWCSDESLKDAKTIDLCNNPLTKEPKLDRARRQVPEWTVYDDEIAAVDRKRKGLEDNESRNTKSRKHEDPPATSKKEEL